MIPYNINGNPDPHIFKCIDVIAVVQHAQYFVITHEKQRLVVTAGFDALSRLHDFVTVCLFFEPHLIVVEVLHLE